MNKLVEKLIGNKYYMYNIFYFYFIHTGVKLGTKQLDTFGFNR
jgi:hypothetical protein